MRTCTLCNKSSKRSASRSHSNIRTWGRQFANIQKINGVIMCTRCRKLEKKQAA